jgi:hypothetical protein
VVIVSERKQKKTSFIYTLKHTTDAPVKPLMLRATVAHNFALGTEQQFVLPAAAKFTRPRCRGGCLNAVMLVLSMPGVQQHNFFLRSFKFYYFFDVLKKRNTKTGHKPMQLLVLQRAIARHETLAADKQLVADNATKAAAAIRGPASKRQRARHVRRRLVP